MSIGAGNLDLDKLPPEYRAAFEAQQAQIVSLSEANADLSERNQRLEHLVREFRQALYGRKSEKLDADERQLAFEDLETAMAEAADAATMSAAPRRGPTAGAKRNLGRLPKELPRVEVVIEPDNTLCPCGCGEMVKIGEDRSERLDIVPTQFRVIATVRPRYACPGCEAGVVQAASPARLIEGGLPTEGAIAQVLVAKYADHTPLYRQCQIMRRSGLALDRSTLAGWVGRAAFHLAPVVDRLAEHLKSSGKLFMDETRAPVLDPGRGKTKSGYLWALARDDRRWGGADPPGVVYFYADGRGGHHAETFLDGFSGILQVDAYAGYNRLTRADRPGGSLVLANCWAHARRKLREVYERDGSKIAEEGLKRIAELYRIEAEIRGRSSEERLTVRQKQTAPLVKAFGVWLKQMRARVSANPASARSLVTSPGTGRGSRSSSPTAASKSTPMPSRTQSVRWPSTGKMHSSQVTTKAVAPGAASPR